MRLRGALRYGRRDPGTPAVVFLDDLRWDAFTQLSARLRRAGVRTVRLTTEASTWSRLSSWLLYDRHVVLTPGRESDELSRVLRGEHVVDLQFVETLSELVAGCLGLLDEATGAGIRARLQMMDKLSAARVLDAAGVPSPEVLPITSSTPAQAVAALGLPLVAKRRVGCGGDSVVIASDLGALESAASSWESDDYFFERYVDGEKFNYAAAVSDDGVEQELAYRVSRWRLPAGTATEVETIDDPALLDVGRRALEASGCKGLVNLDVLRDADGRDWVIDFNARAFGGGANFLSLGLDISEGYLLALGLRDAAPSMRTPAVGARIAIFPTSLSDERNQGSVRKMGAAFLRESRPYLRWLGARYWVSELLRVPDVASARRRSHAAAAPPRAATL